MSLASCIPGLVQSGQLTPEQADHAMAVYGRLKRQHAKSMGEAAAEALASEQAIEALERAAKQAKRQKLLQIAAQKNAVVNMANYEGERGKAAMALFDHIDGATYMNVEALRRAILGRAHAQLADVLEHFKRSVFGAARHTDDMADVVRELFGRSTGNDQARGLAEAWTASAEYLRKRYNAAGGAIGKLERWGLPQSHDSIRVRQAGFTEWRDFIMPLLDRERMIDDTTGAPFETEALLEALRNVYDTIRTDGWVKRTPGGMGKGKLANQRQDHRFLHFRDPDGWLAYNERFGTGSPFEAMMAHVEGMARDIAHMEILGPNPTATVKWLQDGLMKGAALDGEGKLVDSARWYGHRIGQLYDATSGAMGVPVHGGVARGFGTLRSVLTSALLGGAALSAITDVGFQRQVRAFNGLPQVGAITGYLKMLRPSDRKLAVRSGLIAEEASKIMAAQARYVGDTQVHRWGAWLSDNVLRWSGLSPWTQAGRWAFGMEFLGALADRVDKDFDALEAPLRRAMERYGVDARSWDIIRSTPLHEEEGARILRPQDIDDEALGDRLLGMVLTETDYAVPTATVRARSAMNVAPAGTFWGEVSRSVAMFKSFGVSVLLNHGARAASLGVVNGAIYASSLVIGTTLLGGLAIQLKEISRGRDPRPMDGDHAAEFWGAAMLQGGGFGIFGDFLSSTQNRYGGGLLETAAGPVAGLAVDLSGATVGNIFEEYRRLTGRNADGSRPKGANLGRDATKLLQRYTPGSSLWYSRLAMQRILFDNLQEWVDPDYRDAFRRLERRAAEGDQAYWWRPGRMTPDRAPDIANVGGGD